MIMSKKWFVIIEVILAVVAAVLAFIVIREQSVKNIHKVSVILPDSEARYWSAFRYGLKMAAEDQGIELFVVSTGSELSLEEEMRLIRYEIEHGADALIIQPVSEAAAGKKIEELTKKLPVMLVGDIMTDEGEISPLPVTGPDDYAIGKALAQEVLRDFNGNVKGKALGFAVQDENAADVISRKKGFEDALQGKGVRVSWTVSVSMEKSGRHRLENQSKTDIVVALDDISLIRAGECSAANDLHGAMIYGIGHSTEAIYYLDTGVAECLVVPDEFNRGYQSLTETAETLGHVWHVMKNKVLSHKVIRREELFLKENQEILFAMNQ